MANLNVNLNANGKLKCKCCTFPITSAPNIPKGLIKYSLTLSPQVSVFRFPRAS